jgi:hypothetical protein
MDNISNSAKLQIESYSNVNDKNRVCPKCGFEKTMQSDVNGFCLTCQSFYSFYQIKVKTDKKSSCTIQ